LVWFEERRAGRRRGGREEGDLQGEELTAFLYFSIDERGKNWSDDCFRVLDIPGQLGEFSSAFLSDTKQEEAELTFVLLSRRRSLSS